MLKDMHLWELVKKRFAPLGTPSVGASMPVAAPILPTTLDLHGFTVQGAHARVLAYIEQARVARYDRVVIITGRSGQIRQEFPTWMKLNPDVRRFAEMNGGGAFEVRLRRALRS